MPNLNIFSGQGIQLSFQSIAIECDCASCPTTQCTESCNKINSCSSCPYDYVQIYDGTSNVDPLLLKTCGSQTPQDIKSTGSAMYIQFSSDSSYFYSGFSATYYYYVPA